MIMAHFTLVQVGAHICTLTQCFRSGLASSTSLFFLCGFLTVFSVIVSHVPTAKELVTKHQTQLLCFFRGLGRLKSYNVWLTWTNAYTSLVIAISAVRSSVTRHTAAGVQLSWTSYLCHSSFNSLSTLLITSH
jgi:hypothetical protein